MTYRSRVTADIGRWVEAGLVDAATGARLRADVDARAGVGLSFGVVLATFAALLLSAALLVFVAADWDAIPRALRVGGLVVLIGALLVAGHVLKGRGQEGLGEALLLVAGAAWGGAVLLVALMYGWAADGATILLGWCFGVAGGAVVLRSPILSAAASALGAAWAAYQGLDVGDNAEFPTLYPILALGLWAVGLFAQSVAGRSLALLSLVLYGALLAIPLNTGAVGVGLALVGSALFALAARAPAHVEGIVRVNGQAPYQFLVAALAGLALVQFDLSDGRGFGVAAAVTLGVIAGALVLGGPASKGVRRLCYLAFAGEVALVLAVTLGTMLDTSVFFLLAAVALGIMAAVVLRLEKRWAQAAPTPA